MDSIHSAASSITAYLQAGAGLRKQIVPAYNAHKGVESGDLNLTAIMRNVANRFDDDELKKAVIEDGAEFFTTGKSSLQKRKTNVEDTGTLWDQGEAQKLADKLNVELLTNLGEINQKTKGSVSQILKFESKYVPGGRKELVERSNPMGMRDLLVKLLYTSGGPLTDIRELDLLDRLKPAVQKVIATILKRDYQDAVRRVMAYKGTHEKLDVLDPSSKEKEEQGVKIEKPMDPEALENLVDEIQEEDKDVKIKEYKGIKYPINMLKRIVAWVKGNGDKIDMAILVNLMHPNPVDDKDMPAKLTQMFTRGTEEEFNLNTYKTRKKRLLDKIKDAFFSTEKVKEPVVEKSEDEVEKAVVPETSDKMDLTGLSEGDLDKFLDYADNALSGKGNIKGSLKDTILTLYGSKIPEKELDEYMAEMEREKDATKEGLWPKIFASFIQSKVKDGTLKHEDLQNFKAHLQANKGVSGKKFSEEDIKNILNLIKAVHKKMTVTNAAKSLGIEPTKASMWFSKKVKNIYRDWVKGGKKTASEWSEEIFNLRWAIMMNEFEMEDEYSGAVRKIMGYDVVAAEPDEDEDDDTENLPPLSAKDLALWRKKNIGIPRKPGPGGEQESPVQQGLRRMKNPIVEGFKELANLTATERSELKKKLDTWFETRLLKNLHNVDVHMIFDSEYDMSDAHDKPTVERYMVNMEKDSKKKKSWDFLPHGQKPPAGHEYKKMIKNVDTGKWEEHPDATEGPKRNPRRKSDGTPEDPANFHWVSFNGFIALKGSDPLKPLKVSPYKILYEFHQPLDASGDIKGSFKSRLSLWNAKDDELLLTEGEGHVAVFREELDKFFNNMIHKYGIPMVDTSPIPVLYINQNPKSQREYHGTHKFNEMLGGIGHSGPSHEQHVQKYDELSHKIETRGLPIQVKDISMRELMDALKHIWKDKNSKRPKYTKDDSEKAQEFINKMKDFDEKTLPHDLKYEASKFKNSVHDAWMKKTEDMADISETVHDMPTEEESKVKYEKKKAPEPEDASVTK